MESEVSAAPATSEPAQIETSSSDLAADLDAYDRAREAMEAEDWPEAARRLDAYLAAFPNGRLRLEAELDRVEALTRSGLTAAAADAAERLLGMPIASGRRPELLRLAIQLRVKLGACEHARDLLGSGSESDIDVVSGLLDLVEKCNNSIE